MEIPNRRTDINDLGDTTAGGTPTGTGISGNEVPAIPMTPVLDDADELEEED